MIFTEFIQSAAHTAVPCLSNSTELAASEGGELEVRRSSEAQLRKACDACQLDQ